MFIVPRKLTFTLIEDHTSYHTSQQIKVGSLRNIKEWDILF